MVVMVVLLVVLLALLVLLVLVLVVVVLLLLLLLLPPLPVLLLVSWHRGGVLALSLSRRCLFVCERSVPFERRFCTLV